MLSFDQTNATETILEQTGPMLRCALSDTTGSFCIIFVLAGKWLVHLSLCIPTLNCGGLSGIFFAIVESYVVFCAFPFFIYFFLLAGLQTKDQRKIWMARYIFFGGACTLVTVALVLGRHLHN